MAVTVTFTYDPDEPDEGDRTGMSEAEHIRLTEQLMAIGAYDVEIEKES